MSGWVWVKKYSPPLAKGAWRAARMCPSRSGSSVGSSARPMTRRVRGNSSSGGRPVLAHPCKIKADADKLIRELADYGLWGLEVFYPASTEGQKRGFLSLCAQLGLNATCGSDFHGKNRENPIGGPYEKNQVLECAWREFFER